MSPDFLQFAKMTDPIYLAAGGIVLLLLVYLAISFARRSKQSSEEKQIERTIKQFSDGYLRDVILADGMYGYHFIDYLALFPGQIVIFGLQHYDGYIFGGEQIEEWAQVIDKKSFKFTNPLLSNSNYVQVVKGLISGAEVIGRVIFTGKNSFPKGIPIGVIELETLDNELKRLREDKPAGDTTIQAMWDKLLNIVKEHRVQYNQESP